MTRTKRDIQRDAADLALQDCVIKLYVDFEELDILDIIKILSDRVGKEVSMLRRHYTIEGKS